MISNRPIGVAGAGSIGCFVGGMLAAGGRRVALLARPRVIGEIEANGLRLTSFEGFDRTIAANTLTLSEDPGIFSDAGAVLVTVKSADTAEIADIIAKNASADAVIVSLQNGIGNVIRAARAIAGPARAGRHGAVQCGRQGPRTISSRDFRRYRHRGGRCRHRESAFGAGPEHARYRQHRRRAMGQTAGQSQQRAQRPGRSAAASATGAARLAQAVRRPDGGGASWRSRRKASSRCRRRQFRPPGRRICCGCPTPSSRRCWGVR